MSVALLPDTVQRAEPVPGRPEIPDASSLGRSRPEVVTGGGDRGSLRLADGRDDTPPTRIEASPTEDVSRQRARPTCGRGDHSRDIDRRLFEGPWTLVSRTGTSELRVAGLVVSVTGGPPDHRSLVRNTQAPLSR